MATMVTSTKPVVKRGATGGPGLPGPNGGSRRGNGHEEPFPSFEPSYDRYRIGMLVTLAAIVMMFTALTSAYIVRAAPGNDWRPIAIPQILWFSTAVLLVSSVTLEIGKQKLKAALESSYKNWLVVTTLLGIAFLGSQLLAWRQLVAQGIYVNSNPHSSFFYLLTATHGVHLAGGLLALTYLLVRVWRRPNDQENAKKRQAITGAVTLYWHFMDVLWIYLFLLLFFWR